MTRKKRTMFSALASFGTYPSQTLTTLTRKVTSVDPEMVQKHSATTFPATITNVSRNALFFTCKRNVVTTVIAKKDTSMKSAVTVEVANTSVGNRVKLTTAQKRALATKNTRTPGVFVIHKVV